MTLLTLRADFKYVDRGRKDVVVLIPGWASDYRIFDSLNLRFNYLIPLKFSPFSFEKKLLKVIRENKLKKISLFGWSLGGFLAAEFAAKYPDLINQLILVSVRKRFKKEELRAIRNSLKKNKKGSLHKFYIQCFSNKQSRRWFRKTLFGSYYQKFSLNYLFEGLKYLENSQITPQALREISNIKIIHGQNDNIAPLKEILDIKNSLPQAEFILIKGQGHAVFLEKDLSPYL